MRIFFSSLRLRFNQVALNFTLINGTIALLRCQLDGNVLRDIFGIFLITFPWKIIFYCGTWKKIKTCIINNFKWSRLSSPSIWLISADSMKLVPSNVFLCLFGECTTSYNLNSQETFPFSAVTCPTERRTFSSLPHV